MHNIFKRIAYSLLLICLLADLSFSFFQHLSQPLDGDMAGGIVPASDVSPVLGNPLGYKTLVENEIYPNPNRFFSHWMFFKYFNSVPIFLQKFIEPIESIYLSCAIAKIILQIFLLFIMVVLITGTMNVLKLDFMMAAVLITPLFQTNGYRPYMGIVDQSTTYTFFYALPIAFLMLYLVPFFLKYYHNKDINLRFLQTFIWFVLAFIICLSGPLNPGIVLTIAFLIVIFYAQKAIANKVYRSNSVSKDFFLFVIPICIISIYSLFIGSFNSISIASQIPLKELYLKLPEGILIQFTNKLGFPLLFAMILINIFLIKRKYQSAQGKKITQLSKWVFIFSIIYILLLPFGGYRSYRPHVLRFDTIMPITIAIICLFGISTIYIIKAISRKQKIWYFALLIGVLFVFTNSDEALFDKNKCEKNALEQIAKSKESIVVIESDCRVLSWGKINKPEDSELNALLLQIWNITKDKKLYYNK